MPACTSEHNPFWYPAWRSSAPAASLPWTRIQIISFTEAACCPHVWGCDEIHLKALSCCAIGKSTSLTSAAAAQCHGCIAHLAFFSPDYGVVLMVVAWSALSFAIGGAPDGVPRKVATPNTWEVSGQIGNDNSGCIQLWESRARCIIRPELIRGNLNHVP